MKYQTPDLSVTNKAMNILMYVMLGILGVVGTWYIYLNVYPYDIIDIQSIELSNGGEYSRGDEISFNVSYSKAKNFPSETFVKVLCADGNLVTMDSFKTSLPLTGGETMTAVSPPFTILDKVSNGECWFEFEEHTKVNSIRTIIREFESEHFMVLPEE